MKYNMTHIINKQREKLFFLLNSSQLYCYWHAFSLYSRVVFILGDKKKKQKKQLCLILLILFFCYLLTFFFFVFLFFSKPRTAPTDYNNIKKKRFGRQNKTKHSKQNNKISIKKKKKNQTK
jgi:hypothetical protein